MCHAKRTLEARPVLSVGSMTLHHRTFDTIIIGGGQAGPSLASKLDAAGEKVAVLQDGPFGGTCLNDGCRPTKALRASARVAHLARTSARFGVHVDNVRVDVAEAVGRKDAMIGKWRDSNAEYYENHETISYVVARGRLAGKRGDNFRVEFGDEVITAPRVILNPGARSVPPPIPGLEQVRWHDHHSILDLHECPEHLVVVGGSYIALELGQIFARFGARVTILERGPHLVPREDPDMADAMAGFLTEEGIDVRTSVGVQSVEPDGLGVRVHLVGGAVLDASHLLIAAGRVPNSDDLGLDSVGVMVNEHGYVATNGHFLTSTPGIYAVGDVNGRGAFTHTSYQDHEILADHLAGGDRTADGRIVTYAVFTDPPMGRVGLTEREAREAGLAVSVATVPMSSVTRGVLDGETDGMMRLVIDDAADRVVGAAFLGLHGDEVIQAISLLMHVDAPASALATWLPIHPTVAEFLPTVYGGRE